ncbi:MAG: cytochrome P450 [Proteobacteria bacterium]|nr:cytochrome P450 [Pseudomonadota bacterium]
MTAAPTHPVREDIRIMDPSFHADPHEAYAWMRKHAPVYWDADADTWDGRGAWGITRYDDIREVSSRHDLFSVRGGSRPDAPPVPSMINHDAPEHLARRAINRQRFTPTAVKRYEAYVREVAIDLIEGVRHEGTCDLVRDLAMPLPMMIIGKMMDLPDADYERLLHWSDLIATGFINMPVGFAEEVRAAAGEFERYINEWFRRRREDPGDDILSAIVQAKVLGRPLRDKDRMHEALLLLVGGDETTRHVITGGVVALLENREQFDALKSDFSRIPTAVEEMLRWVTPVKTIARKALKAVELGGQKIGADDKLITLFESGNRDDSVFDRPHEFDIGRDPNRHLSFGGYGRHHCLGAHLARLEIRVMLEEMLGRMPELKRADVEPIPKRFGTFVLGYERVEVSF